MGRARCCFEVQKRGTIKVQRYYYGCIPHIFKDIHSVSINVRLLEENNIIILHYWELNGLIKCSLLVTARCFKSKTSVQDSTELA